MEFKYIKTALILVIQIPMSLSYVLVSFETPVGFGEIIQPKAIRC